MHQNQTPFGPYCDGAIIVGKKKKKESDFFLIFFSFLKPYKVNSGAKTV